VQTTDLGFRESLRRLLTGSSTGRRPLLAATAAGLVLGLTATVTVPMATGAQAAAPIQNARQAKARWTAVAPRHYRFTYRPTCFCGLVSGRITVTDGRVTSWQPDPGGGSADATVGGASPVDAAGVPIPTVDDVIAKAAEAEEVATGRVAITYDPSTGIPTSATIDWMRTAFDEETGWSVSDVEILP